MAKKAELAVIPGFSIITDRFSGMDEELLQELQDEMEDLDDDGGITCRMIKVPSGGGLAYEVQGEEDDDDLEYLKEVNGVIVFTHRLNALWEGDYGSEDGKIPVCSSMDAKVGIRQDTGEVISCDRCPCNAYGSDPDGGRGKACKNMRRVYLMMDGDPNFYLLTVPPTSIKDVNKQLARIMGNKGIPYTGLIVTFRLEKAENANGIKYSKVVIEKKGILPPATAAIAREMRRQIKEKYKELSITSGDCNTAAANADGQKQGTVVATAAFEEVTEAENYPF